MSDLCDVSNTLRLTVAPAAVSSIRAGLPESRLPVTTNYLWFAAPPHRLREGAMSAAMWHTAMFDGSRRWCCYVDSLMTVDNSALVTTPAFTAAR